MKNYEAYGRSAFPISETTDTTEYGMTLRDYFAATLPSPTENEIELQYKLDKACNPYNESHKPKLRERKEVIADLRYIVADAMLEARK